MQILTEVAFCHRTPNGESNIHGNSDHGKHDQG